MRGLVFDIERFAVHDGPGIRTAVFTKGCAFTCPWCQNPEGRDIEIGLWYFENKCVRCHECIKVCPENALSEGIDDQPHIVIERTKCIRCGACVRACCCRALVFDAKEMDSREVLDEVLRDHPFYEASGGGVTITGGDPLYQYEFNLEILGLCRENALHTAIETNLYAPWPVVSRFVDVVNLFLVDLKLWDSELHRKFTGGDVEPVRSNLEVLARRSARVIVRISLIPGVTATPENVRNIARYVRTFGWEILVELVNFNPLARAKYRRMGKPYGFAKYESPLSENELDVFRQIVNDEGVRLLSGAET